MSDGILWPAMRTKCNKFRPPKLSSCKEREREIGKRKRRVEDLNGFSWISIIKLPWIVSSVQFWLGGPYLLRAFQCWTCRCPLQCAWSLSSAGWSQSVGGCHTRPPTERERQRGRAKETGKYCTHTHSHTCLALLTLRNALRKLSERKAYSIGLMHEFV